MAQQQGKYMASLVRAGLKPGMELPGSVTPFKYGHKGSLAYVGNDNAVMVRPPPRSRECLPSPSSLPPS